MPNPFLLQGFDFLLFYFVFSISINWGVRRWIYARETDGTLAAPQLASDPYKIAYLRGGEHEALKVATIALVDRGLLIADEENLTSKPGAVDLVNRSIEKAILTRYRNQGDAEAIFTDAAALAACDEYRETLARQGLLVGPAVYRMRLLPVLLGIFSLLGVAAIKIAIAFSQGRHNVLFLVALAAGFSLCVYTAYGKRATRRGEAMLADLKLLFARLQRRAGTIPRGGQSNEVALLAAVFGIAALQASQFSFARKLYRAKSNDGGGGGDSGGDSGGSSCGSSCGGGCGGGCGG